MNNSFQQILVLSFLAPFILWIILILSTKLLLLKNFLSKHVSTGISSGLIISLTFFHFIPESLENHSHLNFSITLVSTLFILLIIETQIIPRLYFLNKWIPIQKNLDENVHHEHLHHYHPSHTSSFSAIGCMLVCSFFDGLSLGSALLIDIPTLITLALALLIHILPEGLLIFTLAQSSSLSLRISLILQALFCFAIGIGILVTGLFMIQFSGFNILAMASGSLIYVGFIHLLPMALQKEKWFFITLILSSLLNIFISHSH